ncbi:hypothetical protein CEXT_493161 [Caerostris extrusa]|uniref:Uncharacterized protein n=1 Tax=Caerostris extrusa TaxID=172846 RepID=A0AAV4S4J6_CAEEX|nr:hypothetical protein CEXT_493161 [Caerostris extrusa]
MELSHLKVSGNASSSGKRFQVLYFSGGKKLFLRYSEAGAAMVLRGSGCQIRFRGLKNVSGNASSGGKRFEVQYFCGGEETVPRFAPRYSEAKAAMVYRGSWMSRKI